MQSLVGNDVSCMDCHGMAHDIEHLDEQINEWLDENKEITLKFANSTIGMFEGKHTEPNLIFTFFY